MPDQVQPRGYAAEGPADTHHRTVLVSAFEGWNDAAQAATGALRHLLKALEIASYEVGRIRSSSFFDYRSTRPVICCVEGRRQILWPEVTFYTVDVSPSLTLLIEIGPEPSFSWIEFSQRTLRIADEYDINEVITLGSMFNDVPHTRQLPLFEADSDDAAYAEDSYSGPIGIPSVLNITAAEQGYKTLSLWVSIPQYTGTDNCPAGILALISRLGSYLNVELPKGDLLHRTHEWALSADALLAYNDDLKEYVRSLEKISDREAAENSMGIHGDDIPQGLKEQLVNEAEEFLNSIDTDNRGASGVPGKPEN